MDEFSLSQRMTAEFLGTLWLVLGGCGSAVLAAAFPEVGIGLLGVSFAFGLSVLTMAYALGHVSGGHFNPAVTVGLCTSRRFLGRDVIPHVLAQVAGAIAGAGILYVIASGKVGFTAGAGSTKEIRWCISLKFDQLRRRRSLISAQGWSAATTLGSE